MQKTIVQPTPEILLGRLLKMTRGAAGRFFFNVMAALAVMERELILEWTNAGLAAARLTGKVGGRRPSMPPSKLEAARKLLHAGQAPKEVANVVGVSLATLYRHLPASELAGRSVGRQIVSTH